MTRQQFVNNLLGSILLGLAIVSANAADLKLKENGHQVITRFEMAKGQTSYKDRILQLDGNHPVTVGNAADISGLGIYTTTWLYTLQDGSSGSVTFNAFGSKTITAKTLDYRVDRRPIDAQNVGTGEIRITWY